jgi:hypothetical protein
MTVVQKDYFTIQSIIKPKYEPQTPETTVPPIIALGADITPTPTIESGDNIHPSKKVIASGYLPDWFINAIPKYKKIVRVLGSTINFINSSSFNDIEIVSPTPGFRMFSNLATHSNIVMETVTVGHDNPFEPEAPTFTHTHQTEGFVMMINNYNSVKEYDITFENIREIKFYLRPWNSVTSENSVLDVDFVCELELLLIDDS